MKAEEFNSKKSTVIKLVIAILVFILLVWYLKTHYHYFGRDYDILGFISVYICFIGWLIGRKVNFELEGDRISELKDSIYGAIGIIIIVIGFILSITRTKLYCHETVLNNQVTPTYCLFVGETN